MGEIGQFGDITFEVSDDKIVTFNNFRRDTASKYKNHELIGQKPRTEYIAPGLDIIAFTVILNAQFGVNPRDEMNRWLEYCRSGDAEWLAIGGRLLGVDKWIVKSVSQEWGVIYDGGILASGKVNISLQEYCSQPWTVRGYHAGLIGKSDEKLRALGMPTKTMETIKRLEKENNPSYYTEDNNSFSLPNEIEFGGTIISKPVSYSFYMPAPTGAISSTKLPDMQELSIYRYIYFKLVKGSYTVTPNPYIHDNLSNYTIDKIDLPFVMKNGCSSDIVLYHKLINPEDIYAALGISNEISKSIARHCANDEFNEIDDAAVAFYLRYLGEARKNARKFYTAIYHKDNTQLDEPTPPPYYFIQYQDINNFGLYYVSKIRLVALVFTDATPIIDIKKFQDKMVKEYNDKSSLSIYYMALNDVYCWTNILKDTSAKIKRLCSFDGFELGKFNKGLGNYQPYYNLDSNGNFLSNGNISRYTLEYIEFIKAYETHAKNGNIHILDNGGQTIAYGHDLRPGENFSGGLNEYQAINLLLSDLDEKYKSIEGYINTLNSNYGYNININNFSENEVLFLVDFAFNRGAGLVQRPNLQTAGKPYNSLPILIAAVSAKDDATIIKTLQEETKNLQGVYYSGLELRRMDQYEILKRGDFVRDYDISRGYK